MSLERPQNIPRIFVLLGVDQLTNRNRESTQKYARFSACRLIKITNFKLDKRMCTRVFRACTALCTVQSLNIIWQLSTGSGQAIIEEAILTKRAIVKVT